MTPTETEMKPINLFTAAEKRAEFDEFIDNNTDPETGEVTATPEELQEFFDVEEIAHKKLIALKNMKSDQEYKIELITAEITELARKGEELAKPLNDRIDELQASARTAQNYIERYKWLVGQYLSISGITKFNLGVTRAHLKTSSKVVVSDACALSNWPDELVKITRAPNKKALKDTVNLPEGVTIEQSTSLTWI